jgi:molybdopterin-binding protein
VRPRADEPVSVHELGIKEGDEVSVIVKATEVMIATE